MKFKRHIANIFRSLDPGGRPIAERRGRHRPSETQGSEIGEVIPPQNEDKDNVGETVKPESEKTEKKP